MHGPTARDILGGSRHCIAVMLLILALLSMLPSLGETEENTEKKPRFELIASVLHDRKSGLMWTANADLAERTLSWEGAQDYIVRLNMDRHAGYGNWRMPSLEELQTLLEQVKLAGFDGTAPAKTVAAGLLKLGVRNVQNDGYWSSTTNIYYSAEAWYVSMTDGSCAVADKSLYFSLWPVRSLR